MYDDSKNNGHFFTLVHKWDSEKSYYERSNERLLPFGTKVNKCRIMELIVDLWPKLPIPLTGYWRSVRLEQEVSTTAFLRQEHEEVSTQRVITIGSKPILIPSARE